MRTKEPPRRRLERWIEEICAGSKTEAARRIGCDSSYLTHLLSDPKRRAGLDFAVGLKRATADWRLGPIEPDEWVPAALTSEGG